MKVSQMVVVVVVGTKAGQNTEDEKMIAQLFKFNCCRQIQSETTTGNEAQMDIKLLAASTHSSRSYLIELETT